MTPPSQKEIKTKPLPELGAFRPPVMMSPDMLSDAIHDLSLTQPAPGSVNPVFEASQRYLAHLDIPEDALVKRFIFTTIVSEVDYLSRVDLTGKTANHWKQLFDLLTDLPINYGAHRVLNEMFLLGNEDGIGLFYWSQTLGEDYVYIPRGYDDQFLHKPLPEDNVVRAHIGAFIEHLGLNNPETSPETVVAARLLIDYAALLVGVYPYEQENMATLFTVRPHETPEDAFGRLVAYVIGARTTRVLPEGPVGRKK